MSRRSCNACRILLATFSFWSILCSSSGMVLNNATAMPTTTKSSTQRLIGDVQTTSHQNFNEAISIVANSTTILASSGHLSPYQSGCRVVLRSVTYWPGPYVVTQTDTTICPSLATSKMPSRIDATSTLPKGFGVYENTTFATSCAYDDPACYAKCTNMATACGSKWSQWTSKNSYLTFTQSPTSVVTTTITLQSYAYSTSVVREGEAQVTFEYASPIGKPIATTTSVRTLYSMDRIVTRWTEPPPTCTPSAWLRCTKGPDCRACTVQGGTVEVLFWPSASKIATDESHVSLSRSSFFNDSIALHDTISQPVVTAMFGTHTLTSPSVYISFQTAYALNDCGQTVGKARPGALLPMDPQSLFTMRAGLDYFEMTSGSTKTTFYESASFDYNDLIGPVPPSAYTNQPSCLASGCYTIYPDYHPQLALPPQVRHMDPAWASCALDWRGSWDPPIALSRAESVVVPTDPAEATHTEPASPKSTISSPAAMTSAPIDFSDSSQVSTSTVSVSSSSPVLLNPDPLFTYAPFSGLHESLSETTTTESQQSGRESTRLSVTQITTILQIDPGSSTSETMALDPTSALGSTHESLTDNGESFGHVTQPGAYTFSNQEPHVSSDEQVQSGNNNPPFSSAGTSGPAVSVAPNGGLAISDTTITAGGDAITVSSAVYSALPGYSVLIVSDMPAAASNTHSPTNAYEVLSEALSTATAEWTSSSDDPSDQMTNPPFSSNDPSSTDPPIDASPSNGEIILTLDYTTLTAIRNSGSSGIIDLSDSSHLLNSQTSLLTIGSHTLSAAPDGGGIVIDGSKTAKFSHHAQPTQTVNPTTSPQSESLASTSTVTSSLAALPSVQASSSASGTGTGSENEDSGVSLPSVTFASSPGPDNSNGGDGDGNDNAHESGASRLRGWWPWMIGVGGVVMLANA